MELAGGTAPHRVILVAHQDCRIPGARVRAGADAFRTRRAVTERRRKASDRIRRRFGVEPELWFLDRHGARPVRSRPPAAHLRSSDLVTATATT
jgi:hypothetical protein